MRERSIYLGVKDKLRSHAEYAKVQYRDDKPAIRQSINDYADFISKDYQLPDWQRGLLHNYAAMLHPKD